MADEPGEPTPEQLLEAVRSMKVADLLLSTAATLAQLGFAKLDEGQKKVLQDAASFMEDMCDADRQQSAAELKRQETEAGIKVIKFEGAEGEKYLKQAHDSGWEEIIKNNPETGPKLKGLLSQ